MRSLLLAFAAATLLVACGGGAAPRSAPTSSTATRAAAIASPTQSFNLDDMMGFYPQQTVLVADVDRVTAVTLLNHFTRFAIPTQGKAQVATDTASGNSWLYVLDGFEAAAARIDGATVRLRTFDLGSGTERASRTDIGTVAWQRAIATAADGRVFVLKSDARHAWIDAYAPLTLKPLGTVMEKPGCGDRLLASQIRLAIVCLATGEIAVNELHGAPTTVLGPLMPGLAGAVMAYEGSIYAVTADRRFATAGYGETTLTTIPWPTAWTGTVLPDGLAMATTSATAVIAQTDTDGSWLRVLATNVVAPRASLRLAGRLTGAPQFGIMAFYPFAYFTSGGSVRHVQIDSGMLETMTELGQGATIVAVVDR